MRLHVSSSVKYAHLYYAARRVASAGGHGDVFIEATRHGSRSHDHAFEVRLTGDGSVNRRRVNQGTTRDRAYGEDVPFAASYDAWGWFLGHLYTVDPTMKCWAYADAEDFHDKTHGAYLDLPVPAPVPA